VPRKRAGVRNVNDLTHMIVSASCALVKRTAMEAKQRADVLLDKDGIVYTWVDVVFEWDAQ
jgi:hypothetical protein